MGGKTYAISILDERLDLLGGEKLINFGILSEVLDLSGFGRGRN